MVSTDVGKGAADMRLTVPAPWGCRGPRTAEAQALGTDLEDIAVGGASDANYISDRGVPVICGVGAVGDGAHARHEFMYPDEIPLTLAAVVNTVEKLAARG